MKTSEIHCKTALSPSKLRKYALNCYVGCQYACRYCYARFMAKFTNHDEEWGEFVDVKVNIADVLLRELARKRVGSVIISSVCDGWQPLESQYRLTRECLRLLIGYGYDVNILTKSAFVVRDLDILAGKKNVALGMTVTTLDEDLRRVIEPVSSPTARRFSSLQAAAERGVEVWLFVGPLLPFLTDTEENISRLMAEASKLPLSRIAVDRLNLRPRVWQSLKEMLSEHFPELVPRYEEVLFDLAGKERYVNELRQKVKSIAEAHGLSRITILF
ncbi:radical SAM protein [bacterium]|nr:radical SAM protein [bacterium]